MQALIVEPHADSAALLRERLARLGIQSEVVPSAAGAAAAAAARTYDYVFVEVCLEQGPPSGFDLLFTLRASPLNAQAKLVLHSSYLSVPTEIAAAPQVADAYLPKPFRFRELVDLVRPG